VADEPLQEALARIDEDELVELAIAIEVCGAEQRERQEVEAR
jgi:hypothetical protein